MGKRKKKTNKKYIAIASTILFVIVLICIGAGVSNIDEAANAVAETASAITNSIASSWKVQDEDENKPAKSADGTLEMHTIDVGQGDSILFIQGNSTLLIDTGTKAKGKIVVEYLKKLGIKKIDILIGTHPHDDHMGGMAEVIKNFEVGVLYTPDYKEDDITTTWYMEFLNAIDEKNVKWKYPNLGENLKIGEADVKFLAPNSEKYTNKNNYSIATKISYGETDILLTGDAEELAENEILEAGYNIEAEIFKAGHHGSDSSNSEEFINKVKPKYVVISCKYGNTYGHPKEKVMEFFEKKDISVYRTDEVGSIVMTTNRKGYFI